MGVVTKCTYNCAYITAHQCTYPGCRSVLVLDGNLKNRRDVCSATEAGYIEYSNLPGAIKTGCQLSPAATSKFCYYHAPRLSRSSGDADTSGTGKGETQIITAVREKRSGKYYQVLLIAWRIVHVCYVLYHVCGRMKAANHAVYSITALLQTQHIHRLPCSSLRSHYSTAWLNHTTR